MRIQGRFRRLCRRVQAEMPEDLLHGLGQAAPLYILAAPRDLEAEL